jgi:hypothetical protein
MKNNLFVAFACCLIIQNKAAAQSKDTLNFLNQPWETTQLSNDLTWKHHQFTNKSLFNANQNIHIIRLPSFPTAIASR